MNETLIKTISLPNRLTLEIYDQCRKITGDRWLVKMAARIEIPLDGLQPEQTGGEFVNSLGYHSIRYEQQRERNFIGELQKNAVLNDLVTSFLTTNGEYLSHPEFAARFVHKIRLKQKRELWCQDLSPAS